MSSPSVEVHVPEPLRSALLGRVGSLSRWGWEALVLEAVREGLLSRGQAGELLGLGFHEREALFARRGITYDLSEEELQRERADARIFAQKFEQISRDSKGSSDGQQFNRDELYKRR